MERTFAHWIKEIHRPNWLARNYRVREAEAPLDVAQIGTISHVTDTGIGTRVDASLRDNVILRHGDYTVLISTLASNGTKKETRLVQPGHPLSLNRNHTEINIESFEIATPTREQAENISISLRRVRKSPFPLLARTEYKRIEGETKDQVLELIEDEGKTHQRIAGLGDLAFMRTVNGLLCRVDFGSRDMRVYLSQNERSLQVQGHFSFVLSQDTVRFVNPKSRIELFLSLLQKT